jgi:GNAT superfamily N-acetyltransferase
VAETPAFVIRLGRADEGPRLKEIAIASKGYWGYDDERVREWADGGDFSLRRMSELVVFVAESRDEAIGWSSLIPRGDVGWLEDLWIEPGWIGKGVGGALFRHTADHARELGATRLEWEAEPHATGFYEKMGAKRLRETKSEWGRTLAVMGVEFDSLRGCTRLGAAARRA